MLVIVHRRVQFVGIDGTLRPHKEMDRQGCLSAKRMSTPLVVERRKSQRLFTALFRGTQANEHSP